MVVTNPWLGYPIAVVPPAPEMEPLISAMRTTELRPFRIVSHETEEGKVFNAAFFEDKTAMNGFMDWYAENALAENGQYYECLKSARAENTTTPTAGSLRFASGVETLSDSRFGEWQLGMAVRARAAFLPVEPGAPSTPPELTPHTPPPPAPRAARCATRGA